MGLLDTYFFDGSEFKAKGPALEGLAELKVMWGNWAAHGVVWGGMGGGGMGALRVSPTLLKRARPGLVNPGRSSFLTELLATCVALRYECKGLSPEKAARSQARGQPVG